MKHDYTDEEIKEAENEAFRRMPVAKGHEWVKAFLDALPARLPPLPKSLPPRPPRPEPKASQQEAIDAAFLDSRHISLWAVADSPYWEKEAPDRLALAQVYEQVRPQSAEMVELRAELDYARKTIEEKSAEIASLKAALAESEKQFQDKVDEIAHLLDKRDKAQGILKACLSVMPFGNIETHTFENLPERIADLASEIASLSLENERIESELAALRQSTQSAQTILADDGRSLGQVFAAKYDLSWDGISQMNQDKIEAAAQAVAAVVLAQAARRMEAVPDDELGAINISTPGGFKESARAVRARLLAAVKGEVKPVVANEPPQHEGQPDLSGESEKQTEPAWIPHDGGPCPLKDEEVHLWDFKLRYSGDKQLSAGRPPSEYYLQWEDKQGTQGITAYRVLKWKPGFGPEAKAEPAQAQQATAQPWTPAVSDTVRSIPEMALGGQMYWRDLAIQLARVWWKCHNIGASLQHGDLDKDIAFSIVCERHGGRVFHGDTPENAWHKAEEWLLSPDRENFPAACLTPVTAP